MQTLEILPDCQLHAEWFHGFGKTTKSSRLVNSIRRIGLLHPVTVTRDHRLVAGAHRLEACRVAGMSEIHCCFVDGDLLHIELAEIDENLIRNDLDAICIGELALRRDDILESLGLRAEVGQGRQPKNSAESAPLKTTESIANEIGISKRLSNGRSPCSNIWSRFPPRNRKITTSRNPKTNKIGSKM